VVFLKYDKVIIVTPAFCRWEMLEKHFELIQGRVEIADEQWVLLNHYPQEGNMENIVKICSNYNINFFDSQFDRGLHGSLNNFLIRNPQPSRTLLIQVDPDETPPQGFDKAILDVAEADDNIAVVAFWSLLPLEDDIKRGKFEDITGHKILQPPEARTIAVYGIDLDWILFNRGFDADRKYWGSLEADFQVKLQYTGKRIVYILDIVEEYPQIIEKLVDLPYREYKNVHSAGDFDGSYEEYLKFIK